MLKRSDSARLGLNMLNSYSEIRIEAILDSKYIFWKYSNFQRNSKEKRDEKPTSLCWKQLNFTAEHFIGNSNRKLGEQNSFNGHAWLHFVYFIRK